MPSPTPVRRILATTREIGMAMLLRIPNPESRIPVIQKIPHSVPQSLAAGFEMRLRPPFGPRHVAARAGAVAQPGRGVEHDRKSVVSGTSVSVGVDLGGRRLIK